MELLPGGTNSILTSMCLECDVIIVPVGVININNIHQNKNYLLEPYFYLDTI